MEIRVVKFEIPTTGGGGFPSDSPYHTQETTVDANGHSLPSGQAKAHIVVANGAVSTSGTSGTTDHLSGSLGFGMGSLHAEQFCVSYYSRDNEGTTVTKRRTVARSNYIPHPSDTVGTWGFYADSAEMGQMYGGVVRITWNPVATGRGGTLVLWIVYGDDVKAITGTSAAPHDTSSPISYPCFDLSQGGDFSNFRPRLVFLLAADITSTVPWESPSFATQNLNFDTDAGMSFGIGTADPDGTNLAFRSLTWRDESGLGTSASGLYFSDDYVVVGEVDGSSGAISAPIMLDSVSEGSFTLDIRTGVQGFQFAYLAIGSPSAEIKLETFTTPSATGYANQAIGSPLGNPQGVLMMQTQVPSASVDRIMTNPVSATWGIGMGHQTTLDTAPVSFSVGFQVEDASGTSDTQSSWAQQLGYLVKKHGASATVSDFDWATHTAGSADPTSVDWVTNTTATGVVNRQWAGLFVGYGQQIPITEHNNGAQNIIGVNVIASTTLITQTNVGPTIAPTTAYLTANGNHPAFAGLSSCVQQRSAVVDLRFDPAAILALGIVTDPRNEPVAAVAIGDALSSVTRTEPVAASVVSDAVAGLSRTEPVAATAVLDIVGSQ